MRADSVDLDEVAHDEPPHQDLRCLRIRLFLSLVFKELMDLGCFLPWENGTYRLTCVIWNEFH